MLTCEIQDGFERQVYLINGQQPGPLIEMEEGDDLEVFVYNQLSVETTIHWHGLLQTGTPHMDGVPGVTQVSTLSVSLTMGGSHLLASTQSPPAATSPTDFQQGMNMASTGITPTFVLTMTMQ